ncbi:programmed cell death protein 5-like [Corticium candelabrum]|uniref:programmed cell death protein 5-like n=1 Tax=Corticium candelabrum TaxID=121492 RepID=UPI002E2592A7|nr:programmed cell death protein 5-like [Corticium candelabrum]
MDGDQDAELQALRARRMAEMQAQYGGGQEDEKKKAEAQREQELQKNSILSQILDQAARARLNTIAQVKPEKAQKVEGMLIQMAQTGQLGGKVTENQLKSLLEQVSQVTQKKTVVKFDRRRHAVDSDDDEYG